MLPACAEAGLEVVELPEETIEELDAFLPGWWSRGNPIDLVAGTSDPYAPVKVAEVALKCPVVDVVLFLGIGYRSQRARYGGTSALEESMNLENMKDVIRDMDVNIADRLAELLNEYGKPIFPASEIVLNAYGPTPNAGIHALEGNGIVASFSLATVARTISRMVERAEFLDGIPRTPPRLKD